METLPKALADEIESLEELDARALKRKYPALLSDASDCSASGILRCIVAYRLQEKHYGRPLAEDAKSWLEADDGGDGPRLRTAVSGSGARARKKPLRPICTARTARRGSRGPRAAS